jgi:hypothetical protein
MVIRLIKGEQRRPIKPSTERVVIVDVGNFEVSILERLEGVVISLEEDVVFPLAKGDEAKVAEMVGHEQI